ncbi:rhodopsin, GQ-coupled-like isoform X1 [Eriocheir sinensis]|uniref:rhodopsin, GQ-coupled-like isoform X1 n=1 Tax=Eriocheir sinensis TaxID=95602 RepID=UPI0021C898F6|nr:rhodopsin, GQ-coupled-like isoform X1 [Eriocheir sinensis]
MTTDGVAEAVAAVQPYLTTQPPPGTPAMTSVASDHPGGATNATFADKFDSRLLWYEDYIVGCFLIIVGLVSLVGNGSIMVMFCRRLRHLTAAEVLLLNLAVMHLCLAVFSYPAPTISSFTHRWLFGNLGCQLYGFVCYTLGIATIVSMAALAVVRYLKTCTHTYSRMITSQHMKFVLLGVYLYSFFWALLPLLCLARAYEVEPFGTSCTLNWTSSEQAARVYILLVVVFVVVVPFLVMFWCYLEIVLLVRRNHRKKLIMSKRSGHSQGRTELQLTLVSGLVCVGYLVGWLPYTVVSVLYGLLGRESPIYLTLAPVLLAKSSCAYNPVIYVFINVRYRRQMLAILCETIRPVLCCLAPQPCDTTGKQPAETSQEIKLSRTGEANPESIVMEEIRPLTAATAATTLTVASRDDFNSAVDSQTELVTTPLAHSPEHPLPPQQEDGMTAPAASSSSGQALEDTHAAGALNSTTIFHPLYSFPEAGEAGEKQSRNGSVVDGQRASAGGGAGDGGEEVSMVSSPTDSGVMPPDSLRDSSVKSQGRGKRASEPEMQPLAETLLDHTKLSPAGMEASLSSLLTSPAKSALPTQHATEDVSPGDAPRPTVHI